MYFKRTLLRGGVGGVPSESYSRKLPKSQKKKIIDITRETTLKLVEDIIAQLDDVSNHVPNSVDLLMPWDYGIEEFVIHSEYRGT